MPAAFVKLVAMLLLVVQGLIAFAPGQVLCIPVRSCSLHTPSGDAPCEHADSDECDDERRDEQCEGRGQGHFSFAKHSDDERGCHIHVLVPDSEQAPSGPRGDIAELRHAVTPLLVAFVLSWDFEPAVVVVERFKPPDFSVSDQVLALKATRLLI